MKCVSRQFCTAELSGAKSDVSQQSMPFVENHCLYMFTGRATVTDKSMLQASLSDCYFALNLGAEGTDS